MLQSLSAKQRLALYNLCTILQLTSYDPHLRAAAETLRDMIRKNTLDMKNNRCEFDKTIEEKKLEASPIISHKHD